MYELDKKLWELSGLVTDNWYDLDTDGKPEEYFCAKENKIDENSYIPYYDTDYLLSVLPKPDHFDEDEIYRNLDCGAPDYFFLGTSLDGWTAQYQIETEPLDEMMAWGNTPRQALLKLAIHLIENNIWDPKEGK